MIIFLLFFKIYFQIDVKSHAYSLHNKLSEIIRVNQLIIYVMNKWLYTRGNKPRLYNYKPNSDWFFINSYINIYVYIYS